MSHSRAIQTIWTQADLVDLIGDETLVNGDIKCGNVQGFDLPDGWSEGAFHQALNHYGLGTAPVAAPVPTTPAKKKLTDQTTNNRQPHALEVSNGLPPGQDMLLSVKQVLEITGWSRSTLTRKLSSGLFPKPSLAAIGTRSKWLRSTVNQFLGGVTTPAT